MICPDGGLRARSRTPYAEQQAKRGSAMKSNTIKLVFAALIAFAIVGGDILASF